MGITKGAALMVGALGELPAAHGSSQGGGARLLPGS